MPQELPETMPPVEPVQQALPLNLPEILTLHLEVLVTPELDQLIYDLCITAIEGGINYWCTVYSRRNFHTYGGPEGNVLIEDLQGFKAYLKHDDGTGKDIITHFIILQGLTRLAEGKALFGGQPWKTGDLIKKCQAAFFCPEQADFDASDADNIVQVGLFGDVVYG